MSIRITLGGQGLTRLQRTLTKLSKSYRAAVQDVIAESALNIESTAKELVAVDTGRLRSSIHTTFRPDRLGATVGSNVKYALEQEIGSAAHPHKRYQPYLGPAYAQERDQFLNNLKAALKAVI